MKKNSKYLRVRTRPSKLHYYIALNSHCNWSFNAEYQPKQRDIGEHILTQPLKLLRLPPAWKLSRQSMDVGVWNVYGETSPLPAQTITESNIWYFSLLITSSTPRYGNKCLFQFCLARKKSWRRAIDAITHQAVNPLGTFHQPDAKFSHGPGYYRLSKNRKRDLVPLGSNCSATTITSFGK